MVGASKIKIAFSYLVPAYSFWAIVIVVFNGHTLNSMIPKISLGGKKNKEQHEW